MPYSELFKTNFENFYKENEGFLPAFAISYRISDSKNTPEEKLPMTYDLTNKEILHSDLNLVNIKSDLTFIESIKDDLKKISGKDNRLYNFKIELVTTPLLWNFLYAYVRMTEDFYDKNRNISKPNSSINTAVDSIIGLNLFSHKRPTELGFNYNKNGISEIDARILRGHDLEDYVKQSWIEYIRRNLQKNPIKKP